ncbi:MAG: putative peptidase rane alanine aminopeptidase, partial [Nitrospirae bacterium]|nr:putative peptidase rane alanine aminopeptidase [Nitrospirota bacterium]
MNNVRMFLRSFVIISLLLFSSAAQAARQNDIEMPENNLEVSFNIPDSSITGTSLISLKKGHELFITTGDLRIISIMINDRLVSPDLHGSAIKLTPGEDGVLEIKYEGVFKASQSADPDNLYTAQSVIDGRGISLTGLWYPHIEGLCRYRLKAVLPKGYEAVSEADDIKKVVSDDNIEFYFNFDHPADGINFIA